MKMYEGGRSLDGAVVTVDGKPLDPRFDIRRFSPAGFEWTYEGDGPRQLALALLADHFGDPQRALALTERFMREVVADLDNAWETDQRGHRPRVGVSVPGRVLSRRVMTDSWSRARAVIAGAGLIKVVWCRSHTSCVAQVSYKLRGAGLIEIAWRRSHTSQMVQTGTALPRHGRS